MFICIFLIVEKRQTLCLIGKDYFCFMDRNARVRLLHEARTKAVALRHTAFLYLDVVQTSHVSQREVLPLLWVDAEQRPEIVDLWRVHATEGRGDVVTRWVGDFFAPIPALFLFCSLTTPVCVTFSLAFPLPQQEEALLLLASSPCRVAQSAASTMVYGANVRTGC